MRRRRVARDDEGDRRRTGAGGWRRRTRSGRDRRRTDRSRTLGHPLPLGLLRWGRFRRLDLRAVGESRRLPLRGRGRPSLNGCSLNRTWLNRIWLNPIWLRGLRRLRSRRRAGRLRVRRDRRDRRCWSAAGQGGQGKVADGERIAGRGLERLDRPRLRGRRDGLGRQCGHGRSCRLRHRRRHEARDRAGYRWDHRRRVLGGRLGRTAGLAGDGGG
jgi:hypothetical protein